MKKQNKGTVAAFCFGLFMVIITPIFAAGQHLVKEFSPLPTEQRYQFINQVKDAVDLPSVGTIVSGGYDHGDGVFSPSVYQVRVEGVTPYELLRDRIRAIPQIQDCIEGKTQLTCRKGQAYIFLSKSDPGYTATFQVTDSSSGR